MASYLLLRASSCLIRDGKSDLLDETRRIEQLRCRGGNNDVATLAPSLADCWPPVHAAAKVLATSTTVSDQFAALLESLDAIAGVIQAGSHLDEPSRTEVRPGEFLFARPA